MFDVLIALIEGAIGAQTLANLTDEFGRVRRDGQARRAQDEPVDIEWNVYGFSDAPEGELNAYLDTVPTTCMAGGCGCAGYIAIVVKGAEANAFFVACYGHRGIVAEMCANADAQRNPSGVVLDAEFVVIGDGEKK
jgi:hypothetical protein